MAIDAVKCISYCKVVLVPPIDGRAVPTGGSLEMISTVTTITVTTITTITAITASAGLFGSTLAFAALITFTLLVISREVVSANGSAVWTRHLGRGLAIGIIPLGFAFAMIVWFKLSD